MSSRLHNALSSPRTIRFFGEPFFWLFGRRGGRSQRIDLSQVRRVLVVRLDEIGDVVLTTPLLRELRRALPDAWITLLVKPAVYNLVELCPYVNEVLIFDWQVSGRLPQLHLLARALKRARKDLWRRQFDLAILPRWDVDYYAAAFLAYFSGAPWRLGYSENVSAHKRRLNPGFDNLFTHILDDRTPKHEVERNLDLLRCVPAAVEDERLELRLSEQDRAFAENALTSCGVRDADALIALGPGAGAPKRRWPIARFIELGGQLHQQYAARLVLVGGAAENQLAVTLETGLKGAAINLVGRASLRQTAAVLERCHLYIGNDAGPMHLAAAAGSAVVEISCHPHAGAPNHPNSPIRFRPWGAPYAVLQPQQGLGSCAQACDAPEAHCILGVQVDRVLDAVRAQPSPQRSFAVSSTARNLPNHAFPEPV